MSHLLNTGELPTPSPRHDYDLKAPLLASPASALRVRPAVALTLSASTGSRHQGAELLDRGIHWFNNVPRSSPRTGHRAADDHPTTLRGACSPIRRHRARWLPTLIGLMCLGLLLAFRAGSSLGMIGPVLIQLAGAMAIVGLGAVLARTPNDPT